MTKQEILDMVAGWLEEYYPKHNITDSGNLIRPEVAKERYREDAGELLTRLHSVAVKAELPSVFDANEDVISALEYGKKLTGYTAFESLIDEIS